MATLKISLSKSEQVFIARRSESSGKATLSHCRARRSKQGCIPLIDRMVAEGQAGSQVEVIIRALELYAKDQAVKANL